MKRFLPFLLLAAALPARAELPVAELKRDKPVDFATEVYPFLKANCLACHNNSKAKADLVLESPQDMLEGGDTGPSIEPGNADNSLLFTTSAHIEDPTMPPANNKSKAKNLTPEQLALLKRWIDEGAKGGAVSAPAPESWTLLTGPQPIYAAAVSPDGRFAAAGRGQRIDVYDLRLGKQVASLRDPALAHPTAHQDLVQVVAFSPDGLLASGGYRTAKIWRREKATAGEPIALPADATSRAQSPDGKVTAIGAADGTIVLVRNGGEKPVTVQVKDHAGAVTALAFSPDGKTLFSTGADKTVKRRAEADPAKSVSLALPAPASALAVINGGRHIALGGADQVLRITHADLVTPMIPAKPAPAATPKPAPTTPAPVATPKPAPATPAPVTKPNPAPATPAPVAKPNPAPAPPKPAPTPAPKPTPEAPAEKKPAPAPAPAAKPEAKPTPKPATPAKPAPATPAPAKPTPQVEAKPQPKPATTPAPKPEPKPQPAPKPIPAKVFVEHKLHTQPIVALAPAKADGSEFLVAHADGTVIHAKIDPAKLDAKPAEVRRIAHGAALTRMAVALPSRIATAGAAGPVKLWNLADGKPVADLAGNPALQPRIDSLKRETAVANRLKAHWDKQAPEAEKLWKAESEKAKEAAATIATAKRDLAAKHAAWKKLANAEPPAKEEDVAKAREELDKATRAVTTAQRSRESSARLAGDAFTDQTEALSAAAEAEALSKALTAETEALSKEDGEAKGKTAATSIAFSPDGTRLAAAIADGGVRLWSAGSGAWLEDVGAASGGTMLALSGGGKTLLATKDKKVIPWTFPHERWTLVKALGDGKSAEPFVDRVGALAFSPDGSRLATGTGVPSRSGGITLWNTETWEAAVTNDEAHDDTITSFAFSPDGSRLASAGTDKFVKVFGTDTLEYQRTFEGHTSHVLDVDWNADDLTLVSSSADLQVKVWDLTLGQEKSKVEGFQKEVSSVAFVGDTDTILTASGDTTLKLSNAPLPDTGGTFLHTADVTADGKVIIAGGQDSVLRVWDAAAKKLLKSFPSPEGEAGKVASE